MQKNHIKKVSVSALILAIVVLPTLALASQTVDLLAGKDTLAGTVTVENDGTHLNVTYETNNEWVLTETHLSVAKNQGDIPATKKGNPKVGKFEYKTEHNPALNTFSYLIPLSDFDAGSGDDLYVAAHAVVQSAEVVQVLAPFYASFVVDSDQGKKKNDESVDLARSNTDNALEFEEGNDVNNFYSLGFGGEITLGFDYPIINGPGDDIRVIEDTWSSYPLEKAEIFASQDGINWESLGIADNTNQQGIHTVSFFDLGTLDWALYIKVVDVSNPNDHNNNADGYDLNAVEALHDYIDINLLEGTETAWGDGERFVDRGNWATYFQYEVE